MAGGFITLADKFFVSPSDPDAKRTVPSLTFLVTHPGSKIYGANSGRLFRLMFDLGLRKAKEAYPEVLQKHIDGRAPHHLPPGVAKQLKDGGVNPATDVDLVMLSHVHYDHHGDPEDFPRSYFVVGQGALNVLEHGLGGIASHQHFVPGTLPQDRSSELSDPEAKDGGEWKPMGPFPATLDLFHDGSVYVVDTPGHLPGHLNLLCRTKGDKQDRWFMLCGDAFHDRRLLTGEKDIGTWEGPSGGTLCIHLDKEKAAESIRRLQEFEKVVEKSRDDVELIAAHEEGWWESNKGKAFPGVL
ncbi:hypothetical protein LTR86_008833 [Recurvomyces mirabilis]|nr:hypothetical protein LTR86_008833 [Recurvomyces mirabilis]